ncbi:MAG TPA: class I SAM-dependent methyltransferase [Luteimonas sp.]|nr:class I SAM-dependent methyltransferase [Luteimonas sp.]HRP71804.1 class I SAM-dependent methyltransferase [Luteimonas sp.]
MSASDQARAGIARWDARFSGEDYVFGIEPNAFLAAQAHRLQPGMSALAVADGEGRNGVWLAEQGLQVLSVDASQAGLAKARALATARGVHIDVELSDLAHWDWGQARFDVVAAIFIQFADPPLRDAIFAGMQRVLKPGGLLLLQGYRPEQLRYGTGGPPVAEQLYTADLLRDAFAGMRIEHLAEHDSVIHEGQGHAGMSALIDLVAVKS